MGELYTIACAYHSGNDGHSDSFHLLVFVNSATIAYACILFSTRFPFFWNVNLIIELLGHVVILCLTLCRAAKLFFSTVAEAMVYVLTRIVWRFWLLLHIHTNTSYSLFVLLLCVYVDIDKLILKFCANSKITEKTGGRTLFWGIAPQNYL